MTGDIPESKVVNLWQGCAGREDLATEEEGPVKVLYRGRPNGGGGADFRDAVIQMDRGLLTGDIEIHTKSSDWRAHRHHLDPVYNRVVLHVVLKHDTGKSVMLENGRSVPTLTLQNLPAEGQTIFAAPVTPCRGTGKARDIELLRQVLDEAGEQRFRSRAAGFQTASSPAEAGQALYRGIMTALGYAQNKHQMAELACRMPLHRLESMVTAQTPDGECLAIYQALLLGAAGLLASQRTQPSIDDTRIKELEKYRLTCGDTVNMSEKDWQFFRVRPVNYPTRRIFAMSRLLLRYRDEGLLKGIISGFEAITGDGGRRGPAGIFTAGVDATDDDTPLMGKDRADLIVVNVLLPFTAACGRLNTRPETAAKAEKIYRAYPAPSANAVERHMRRQLGIDSVLVNTACRQQGLLHLFKTYCSLGKCGDCPLRQAE